MKSIDKHKKKEVVYIEIKKKEWKRSDCFIEKNI